MICEKGVRAEQNFAAAHPRGNAELIFIYKSVNGRHSVLEACDRLCESAFEQSARNACERTGDKHRLLFLDIFRADALGDLGFYNIGIVNDKIVDAREVARVRIALNERGFERELFVLVRKRLAEEYKAADGERAESRKSGGSGSGGEAL